MAAPHPLTTTLTTPRLLLRPLRIGDAPTIQAQFPRIEIVQYLTNRVPWPYPANGAENFLANIMLPAMAQGTQYGWAITLPAMHGDELCGLVDFSPTLQPTGFQRGFWLVPALWGQGLMWEAVAAVNDFAHETLGLELLVLENAKANLASARLKAKAGAVLIKEEMRDFISGRQLAQTWHQTLPAWRAARATFLA